MKQAVQKTWLALVGLTVILQMGGCPQLGASSEVIDGGQGKTSQISSSASVNVLTPASDISITGGTQIEVNWSARATTRFAVQDVIVDLDQDPSNGNETIAFSNLELTANNVLVDTTLLAQGTYYVGVRLEEIGVVVAYDYAPGRVTIDQRPILNFVSPASDSGLVGARDNVAYDHTAAITVRMRIVWELDDPDSTDNVTIYLDSDELPNGNEILLYESNSQTGDSFDFDLPTGAFEPSTYRLLAVVGDGRNEFPFYAPGSVRIRARLAGAIDLRGIEAPESQVRGAVFEGFNPRDNAGSFLSSVTDIDGDGFSDFIILAQFAKPRYSFNVQRTGIGEAYLLYGRSERFSGLVNLNSTGTLFRGEIYTGPPETADPLRPSRGITSFAVLSDWDSDGVREMAFGVPFTDSLSINDYALSTAGSGFAPLDKPGYFRTGAVVVAAGSSLRPDLGFPGRNVCNLAEFGTLGHVARSCGICTDPDACACLEGFYGPKAPSPLNGCPDTKYHQHIVSVGGVANAGAIRLGCRFSSTEFGDQYGESISAWDFDSIVMAAPNRDPFRCVERSGSVAGAGVVSVFYCDVKSGFYPWTNTNAPAANTDFNYPGSLNSAGDRLLPHGGPYHYVMDDILIQSVPYGTALLSLSTSPGFFVDPDDAAPCGVSSDARIMTPARSIRFWSTAAGARLGNVHGTGDLNGDGLLDLLIGAPFSHQGAGACYLVPGRLRDVIMSGELQLEELNLPMNGSDSYQTRIFDGIRIVGAAGDRLGQSQDSAGDFNNDGLSDVVIGSPFTNSRAGGAAVFFGSRDVINMTEAEIPFDEIASRGLGVIFRGQEAGDLAGARVTSAGDVDGDGNSDILIAAPDRSVRMDIDLDGVIDIDRTQCGVVYLVYGSPELQRCVGSSGECGVLNLGDIGRDLREGGVPGAVFIGAHSGDHLGAGIGEHGDRSIAVAAAGDTDGDGVGDLLLGSVSASPRNRARAGEVYLIYGVGN